MERPKPSNNPRTAIVGKVRVLPTAGHDENDHRARGRSQVYEKTPSHQLCASGTSFYLVFRDRLLQPGPATLKSALTPPGASCSKDSILKRVSTDQISSQNDLNFEQDCTGKSIYF